MSNEVVTFADDTELLRLVKTQADLRGLQMDPFKLREYLDHISWFLGFDGHKGGVQWLKKTLMPRNKLMEFDLVAADQKRGNPSQSY